MPGAAFLLCDLLVLFGSEDGFVRRYVTIPRCFLPLCEYFFRLVLFLRLLLAFALGLCLPLLERLSPRPHGLAECQQAAAFCGFIWESLHGSSGIGMAHRGQEQSYPS